MSKQLSRRSVLAALAGSVTQAADPGAAVTRFRETQDNFTNPHRGWMTQQRTPGPQPTRLPSSVTYLRVNWAELEPEEGKYNWALFDDPMAAWEPRSTRVAFRIVTANPHSSGYYSSPKWLFDAGCRSVEYLRGGADPYAGGKRIPRIEPDYTDPLYLEKHGNFLRALARRYDAHPRMEFADIGSYGYWGEWHTEHPAPIEVRRRIIELYTENFHKLPLAFLSDDAEGLDYALARGTGFRRDGVGSDWHAKNWIGSKKYAGVHGFETAWRRAPVVFEWYGDWSYMKGRNWSFADSVHFMLDNHVTYINDDLRVVPDEEMPLLRNLERRAGYRFVLREAVCAAAGSAATVRMEWSNVGVAPIYRDYGLELSLVAADGTVAAAARAADARQWAPGDHRVEARLPARPGIYTVTASLRSPGGQPAIRLACDAPEVGLLYRIGTVRLG